MALYLFSILLRFAKSIIIRSRAREMSPRVSQKSQIDQLRFLSIFLLAKNICL